ncbi:uncharacterized protein LOC142240034 [Haematobia irritans]|uniref:uncharacterized protein LOC142240034 n=1 Tax=Haematobia irritans TaxID=7368 RepID=UPI003F4FDBE4
MTPYGVLDLRRRNGTKTGLKITYSKQIEYDTEKAAKSQLIRMMVNIEGPLPTRSWGRPYRDELNQKAVFRTALRITSAYRTLPGEAALVIAGTIPIDLQAIERQTVFEAKQQSAKDLIRQERLERWRDETKGKWTHRLITDIQLYGAVMYYMTQMLSGQGYFRKDYMRMT